MFWNIFYSAVCLTPIYIKWVSDDPSTIFLATSFTQKMPESSDSMYYSILMLENIWYHHFTWRSPNSQEYVNLFQFSSGPRGPTNGRKLTISCEFGPLQVKWWYHVFSSITKEEYMKVELFSIFWAKVVSKIIVLRSLGTQREVVLVVWCFFFLRNIQIFWTKLLHLCDSLAKKYTSLNNVKEISFCIVNWAFPFLGPRGPISCGKVGKMFQAYAG